MPFLSNCGANLQEFDFSICRGLTLYSDSDYKRIIEFCPRLTAVRSKTPTGALLSEIGRCYPDLLSLHVSFVKDDSMQSESQGLIALFEGCRKLQKLSIFFATLSEAVLIKAFECCHDLRSLRLGAKIKAARGLVSLAVNCTQLDCLDLSNVIATEEEWLQFSEQSNFRNLRTLRITSSDIDDRSVLEFVRKSPLLQELEIHSCECVTDVGLFHIANHCRNLRKLELKYIEDVSSPDNLINILVNNPKIRKSDFNFSSESSVENSLIFVNNPNDENGNGEGDVVYTAELQALLNSRA